MNYTKSILKARNSLNEYLANARGVIMRDKKLKQQERVNQQMAKIFTVLVQELGFDKVKQVRESSERLTLALQEYRDSNPELSIAEVDNS